MKTIFKIHNNEIQEIELLGEDKEYIYLPAPKGIIYPILEDYEYDEEGSIPFTYEEKYPDGKCPVHKAYIGCFYFWTREEAEKKIVPPPPELIEPSDEEQSTWLDVTRNYVRTLELAWDGYYKTQLRHYNYAIGKRNTNLPKFSKQD